MRLLTNAHECTSCSLLFVHQPPPVVSKFPDKPSMQAGMQERSSTVNMMRHDACRPGTRKHATCCWNATQRDREGHRLRPLRLRACVRACARALPSPKLPQLADTAANRQQHRLGWVSSHLLFMRIPALLTTLLRGCALRGRMLERMLCRRVKWWRGIMLQCVQDAARVHCQCGYVPH